MERRSKPQGGQAEDVACSSIESKAKNSPCKAVARMPWCSEFQANLLESNATGYQCTGSESSRSSACAKASFCPQHALCNILAAPKIHVARPWQAELGRRPYHCIVAIAGKDDHVNGGCVIGHADASISGSVFSKCKPKTQMRAEG